MAGAAATAAEADSSKQPRLRKPPPAGADGRPGVWLDENEAGDDGCWVQLGDHGFVEVADTFMRDPASFKLQRKLQDLCSDKISSILHVLQPSDSSSKALETLTPVEAEWLQQVQAGLCAAEV
ncbi:hypothetical protein OEZ86_009649 [Tetradesmus obliquus]|uniref:Uncharacterized protein n=1 Tax=Tetradesmus obliquus TaxID=3088 RepID=A0ABY8UQU4_TETOB|nr:hypothetical protein OEZ85_001093 [Tetradesmus obliquus]WIA43134.1 hypothetical protein OEZ86_009649 [Tetradesmus obliquus]